MEPVKKVITEALQKMAKHKNAAHLQSLISVFDCECEHQKSWKYFSASEMVNIIENAKPKNKKQCQNKQKKTSQKQQQQLQLQTVQIKNKQQVKAVSKKK